jgi:hypothetical protein
MHIRDEAIGGVFVGEERKVTADRKRTHHARKVDGTHSKKVFPAYTSSCNHRKVVPFGSSSRLCRGSPVWIKAGARARCVVPNRSGRRALQSVGANARAQSGSRRRCGGMWAEMQGFVRIVRVSRSSSSWSVGKLGRACACDNKRGHAACSSRPTTLRGPGSSSPASSGLGASSSWFCTRHTRLPFTMHASRTPESWS